MLTKSIIFLIILSLLSKLKLSRVHSIDNKRKRNAKCGLKVQLCNSSSMYIVHFGEIPAHTLNLITIQLVQ